MPFQNQYFMNLQHRYGIKIVRNIVTVQQLLPQKMIYNLLIKNYVNEYVILKVNLSSMKINKNYEQCVNYYIEWKNYRQISHCLLMPLNIIRVILICMIQL